MFTCCPLDNGLSRDHLSPPHVLVIHVYIHTYMCYIHSFVNYLNGDDISIVVKLCFYYVFEWCVLEMTVLVCVRLTINIPLL